MSSAVRLPPELREFLQLPGPQSLVIRGPPGSGKTTLGLALLESADGIRIQVSNRVSHEELSREFPWLGENAAQNIRIVDASEWEGPDATISHVVGTEGAVLDVDSRERRELSEFLTLPTAVQQAWSQLPSEGRATVVIDSWDALIEHSLGRSSRRHDVSLDRAEVERRLLRWMGRTPAHLILILETDQPSQLDYLANGIAITRRELVDDRLERWLHLPKLRGVRIANATYPYTVEGAKFQCIEPLRPYSVLHRGHIDPKPDEMPGFIWPGSRSFADAFGRLTLGRVTLLEVDDEIPDYVVQHLLTPPKIQTVMSGGRVLVIPSPSLSPDEVWRPIEEAHPPGRLSDVFRVLDVSGQLGRATEHTDPSRHACVISTKAIGTPSPDADPSDNEISRWVGGGVRGGPASLVTMYETGIESLAAALHATMASDVTIALTSSVRSSLAEGTVHLVAVGRVNSPLIRPIRALSGIHLRLVDRQGRVLIYGLKPWTNGFVLAESSGAGPYDLLRIV
jgi:KaiC/GvpD/RAD55 family RecA-like ATPase